MVPGHELEHTGDREKKTVYKDLALILNPIQL